jgi:hypothetical protein
MIKNIDELAKFVKGGAEVLQKAMSSDEEMSLELIDGRFVTDEDLEGLKEKVKNEAKTEGQTIGYDFAMKDLKKDFGLEIEGKDREKIAKALKEKIMADAKIEPSKKINELESSISNLREKYEADKSQWEAETGNYKNKLKDISIMSELQKNTPETKGLKPNQFALLARSEFDFDFDDNGVLVAKKNGEVLKDKMERPLPVKDVLTDFATQNGWYGAEGRGGGNEGGDGKSEFKSMNDVFKYMEENKIDPMSSEGVKLQEEFKNSKD